VLSETAVIATVDVSRYLFNKRRKVIGSETIDA
jgi:hypothetical protein